MFSICAAARGWLLILLSLLVVFPTCGHCLWLVQALAWWWQWAAELGKGSTQSLHSTSKAPLLLLAPLGAHHEEAQLPMSNFLRCSERQKQVRQEKVLPSSWPSSLIIEKSQILLSLACKMAENHLAASGTVARYQLDIAQIHRAIYHCHSCEEKELSLSCPRGMHFQAIPVLYPCSPTPVLLPWLSSSLSSEFIASASLWNRVTARARLTEGLPEEPQLISGEGQNSAECPSLPGQQWLSVAQGAPWGTRPAVVCAQTSHLCDINLWHFLFNTEVSPPKCLESL